MIGSNFSFASQSCKDSAIDRIYMAESRIFDCDKSHSTRPLKVLMKKISKKTLINWNGKVLKALRSVDNFYYSFKDSEDKCVRDLFEDLPRIKMEVVDTLIYCS